MTLGLPVPFLDSAAELGLPSLTDFSKGWSAAGILCRSAEEPIPAFREHSASRVCEGPERLTTCGALIQLIQGATLFPDPEEHGTDGLRSTQCSPADGCH